MFSVEIILPFCLILFLLAFATFIKLLSVMTFYQALVDKLNIALILVRLSVSYNSGQVYINGWQC